jgi:hypothetical protein
VFNHKRNKKYMVLQQQKNQFAETVVEGCYTCRQREKLKEVQHILSLDVARLIRFQLVC